MKHGPVRDRSVYSERFSWCPWIFAVGHTVSFALVIHASSRCGVAPKVIPDGSSPASTPRDHPHIRTTARAVMSSAHQFSLRLSGRSGDGYRRSALAPGVLGMVDDMGTIVLNNGV